MDTIENYKKSLLLYLKLDIAILAVIGSIITIMKFQRNEMFSFVVEIKYFVILVIVLLCLNLFLDLFLTLSSNEHISKNKNFFIRKTLVVITALHLALLLIIGSYVINYSEREVIADKQKHIISVLRKNIFTYYKKNDTLPENLDSLLQEFPNLKTDINKSELNIKYKTNDKLSYEIQCDSQYSRTIYIFNIIKKSYPQLFDTMPIENLIAYFYHIKNRVPYNLSELKRINKNASKIINEYVGENLLYIALDSLSFELRYPGYDGIFNTKDDRTTRKSFYIKH